MIGILFGIVASTGWGFSAVLARLGLVHVRPSTGTLYSMVANLVLILVAVIAFEYESLRSVSTTAIVWFAIVGIVNFPFGRFLGYKGVEYIGAAKGSVVRSSSPFFSMLIAAVFLQEQLTPLVVLGAILIVGGLYVVFSDRESL